MAALWLLVVLANVAFVDRGLCVPVDAKQDESNAGLKKGVSHDDSLKKAFAILQSFNSMLKQQNKAKPAAKVELDDRASRNVSSTQQQNVIFSQLNNSFSHQQNMSNSQQLTNGQQQSYNISNNPAAPVEPDRASHNVSNAQQKKVIFSLQQSGGQLNNSSTQQQSYNVSNVQQNALSHQQNSNMSNSQQLTNGQQQSYNISNNPAAPVQPDRASYNVSNTQQKKLIFSLQQSSGHLNNSSTQQRSYNVSNVQQNAFSHQQNSNMSNSQQLTNGQQQSYNISNNLVAPVQPDRASHNVSNTQQKKLIFSLQQSSGHLNNSSTQQQSYNMSNVQQNAINHNLSGDVSSNYLNDVMDDSAEVYTVNV
ncbi:uncharacterized protein LOC144005517 [Festucalex cinctus]